MSAFFLMVVVCLVGSAQGSERDPLVPMGRLGARIAALGGAGVALEGTNEVVFTNPALLVFEERPEVTGGFGNQDFGDQRQFYLVGSLPLATQLVAGAGMTRVNFPLGGREDIDLYTLSLAFSLSPNGQLVAGLNGKFMRQAIPGPDVVASGGGMDIGLALTVAGHPQGMMLRLGTALIDAQTVLKYQNEEYSLPSVFRFGAAWNISPDRLFTLGYEFSQSKIDLFEAIRTFRSGFEQMIILNENMNLALRIGYLQNAAHHGLVTSGLGITWQADWRMDYGLQLPLELMDAFHQLSLSWSWGPSSSPAVQAADVKKDRADAAESKAAVEKQKRLFSALENAAKLDDTFETVEADRPTSASTPAPKTETRLDEDESTEENYAYNLPVPEGPAGQERASLGVEPEIPPSFSGYFEHPGAGDELRISTQDLRLHVVVNPFSPNGDGRQDNTIFVGRLVTEKLRVSQWVLTVSKAGEIVRSFKGGSQLPRNLEWDGKDFKGKILSDGQYDALLRIFDEFGMESASAHQAVEILTRTKPIDFQGPEMVTLTGGPKDQPLEFTFPSLPGSNQWTFSILNASNKTVYKTSDTTAIPQKLEWSPRIRGQAAPPGAYRAQLNYHDPAGLKAKSEFEFRIRHAQMEITLSAEPKLFKPLSQGGKGIQFALQLQGKTSVKSWLLKIFSEDQTQPIREFKGQGQPPQVWQWDGVSADGQAATAGKVYYATVILDTSLGAMDARSPKLQCDMGDYTGEKALSINLVRVSFGVKSAELDSQNRESLDKAIDTLKRYTQDFQLQVTGHCDPKTEDKQAVELSRSRAQAVANYLITTGGISQDTIAVLGKGAEQPLVSSAAEEDQNKNRRVEVVLFAK